MTEDVWMGEPQAAPPPTVAAAAPAPSTLQHLKEIAVVIEAWVLDRFRVGLRSSWSTRSVDSGRSELVDLMKTIRASEVRCISAPRVSFVDLAVAAPSISTPPLGF
ncbi:hypothetical protein ZWY2020_032642 [Hordeum vulgare]|nr:hypothetical protein ZWY2020_032642 [Hordeum vulgare]